MPKYADHFAGHMELLDPRSSMFGCHGCTWPTIPAYKLFLASQDACGTLSFLNTVGVLFTVTTDTPPPNAVQWNHNGIQLPIISAFVLKNGMEDPYGYQLAVTMFMTVGTLEMDIVVAEQKCNRDHAMPVTWIDGPFGTGCTGHTCKLYQVEFDESTPPGGWPP